MELENIASELQFWARRYAEGRQSVACSAVNSLTEKLILQGINCNPETAGDREGSIWAYDGDPRCCNAKFFEEKYGKAGEKVKQGKTE